MLDVALKDFEDPSKANTYVTLSKFLNNSNLCAKSLKDEFIKVLTNY
jgi:hypothetical protein